MTRKENLGIFIGLASLIIAVSFIPLDGHSLYDKYITGAGVKIEVLYPPADKIITVNYINDGGTSLSNIEIRYSYGWDEDYYEDAENPLKYADLSTRHLENRGDKGSFSIVMSTLPNCTLLNETPKISLYWDLHEMICYTKFEVPLPDNVCVPAQINVTFYSKEMPTGGKQFIRYYPTAYPIFELHFLQPAGAASTIYPGREPLVSKEQECKSYEEAENKEFLTFRGSSELKSSLEWFNNTFKMSEKYCKEGLMPADWCVENNIG